MAPALSQKVTLVFTAKVKIFEEAPVNLIKLLIFQGNDFFISFFGADFGSDSRCLFRGRCPLGKLVVLDPLFPGSKVCLFLFV